MVTDGAGLPRPFSVITSSQRVRRKSRSQSTHSITTTSYAATHLRQVGHPSHAELVAHLAMPRPPARPKRRQAQPNSPRLRIPNQAAARKELADKIAKKPIAKDLPDSDDSDKLVTKGAGGRRGHFINPQPIYASGGVAIGDKIAAHPTRAQRKRSMDEALMSSGRDSQSPSTNTTQTKNSKLGSGKRTATAATPGPSSSAKQPQLIPASARPTPARDLTIIEGIRPRGRQPSILHAPALDNSTLSLDDSFALPDDESTPPNLNKANVTTSTPLSSALSSSASRKRKFGSNDPVRNSTSRPVAKTPSPEPSLPPQPQSISALRTSGQKHRRQTIHREDEDVMAPPRSSSSVPSSPQKDKAPATSKQQRSKSKPALAMTTEELQALMPTKRRKTTREQKRKAGSHFDIAEDSTSNQTLEETDDSFLPSKQRKGRRPKQNVKSKATKSKANKSTPPPLRSTRRRSAKSPAQQNIVQSRSITLSESPNKGERSGGSRLKAKDTGGGKENEDEVLVVGSDEEREPALAVKVSDKKKSYWDTIDDFSLDYEEVDVYDKSSEKDAR